MNNYLPVMLLKGFVILPKQEAKIDLNNSISEKIINLSEKHHNKDLLIICPKNTLEETPEIDDLPLVGVIAHIKSKLELSNGTVRTIVTGISRVNINKYNNFSDDEEILMASVSQIKTLKEDVVAETAIKRKLLDLLKKYVTTSPSVSNSILSNIKGVDDIYTLTDMIAAFLPLSLDKKLNYMEEINPLIRANDLIYDISIELEILKLDEKLDEALQDNLEKNQRDFILRSKLQEIRKELGETSEKEEIVKNYTEKINNLEINTKTKEKLLNELNKYANINENYPESSIIINYLDTVLNLPWNKLKEDNNDFKDVRKKLDETHFGLEEIKNRIIEYLIVKKRNEHLKSPIICLVGPPGVGKTSIAFSIAEALNKEFYKISVGGLSDSAELIGHRRTYLGSNPGKIIQALMKCKVANPLILIDEIDKMGKDFRGDPTSALLDILDTEQNSMFIDNYIEEPFDLSNVMFILTANQLEDIPMALRDRLEVLELSSYSDFEKIEIAKKYLLPKILEEHLLDNKDIKIKDETISYLINNYTKEAGVRELTRDLETIIRKIVTDITLTDQKLPFTLSQKKLVEYLGISKEKKEETSKTLDPGLVNVLACTSLGGNVTLLESSLITGTGKIITTGMLGDVMEESIKVAISYIRSHEDLFQISDYNFTSKDIHLHALIASVKKEGPSAGIAIVTSLLSLIFNKNIAEDIAMTGEITLRGDILAVGGLKEKLIGAYNNNIKKVYIPLSNQNELSDLPEKILDKIEIKAVSNYKEIYQDLFK